MMRCSLPLAAMLCGWTAARADFLIYSLAPGGPRILIEGSVTNHGRTVTVNHPRFPPTVFNREQCEIISVPERRATVRKELKQAARNGSADEVYVAAAQCLRHGWVDDYVASMQQVLKMDSNHQGAKDALALYAKMSEPIEESSAREAELRTIVPFSKMRVERSPHFLMLTDTPVHPEKDGRSKLNRAQQRLELLERVYGTFLLFFQSKGVTLEVPKQRLMVVLFDDHKNYMDYALSISPSLQSASGFYDRLSGVTFFFDHGSDATFRALKQLRDQMEAMKEQMIRARSPGRGDIIRQLNGLDLLFQIWQEEMDITVVTHETTHQLAGATGLFPDRVSWPSWVHEGLATYFEAPKNATWSGIGAVNDERIAMYKRLESDREHSNIEFIVGDKIFKFASEEGETILAAYGQAWAITHFLMDRHFDKLMEFYKKVSLLPRDTFLSPQLLNDIFDSVFDPKDRKNLDLEWRHYMTSLRTDFQKAVASGQ